MALVGLKGFEKVTKSLREIDAEKKAEAEKKDNARISHIRNKEDKKLY